MSTNSQPRGRPPSADVSEAVYRAALEVVADDGLARASRRQIATRAGVSRQTLYNRWATVGDIVLEALLIRGEREIGLDDAAGVASPRQRLASYVAGLASALSGWAAPGLKAVVVMAQEDAAFAARFRADFLEPRRQRLAEVVALARPDSPRDAARIAEFIAGSMWYRLLVSGDPLDDAWVEAMVALVD